MPYTRKIPQAFAKTVSSSNENATIHFKILPLLEDKRLVASITTRNKFANDFALACCRARSIGPAPTQLAIIEPTLKLKQKWRTIGTKKWQEQCKREEVSKRTS